MEAHGWYQQFALAGTITVLILLFIGGFASSAQFLYPRNLCNKTYIMHMNIALEQLSCGFVYLFMVCMLFCSFNITAIQIYLLQNSLSR